SAAAKADGISRNGFFTELAGLAAVFVRHERVAVVGRGHERLLDRTGAHPTDQVPHRARLVVRAGSARAAERLLTDDGAGRLVVDVEITRRIAKLLTREIDCITLAREDRAGQSVRRAPVDQVERLAVLPFGVDVGSDDG